MFRTLRLRYLATLLTLLCVFAATVQSAESEQDTLAITIAPPADLQVNDTPDDGGGSLTLTWKLSPDDTEEMGDIEGYEIFRASRRDTSLKLISMVGDNTTSFTDVGLERGQEYSYALRAKRGDSNSLLIYSDFAQPKINWFRSYRLNMLVLLLVFSASVLLYIRSAKGGKSLFIRKLAGLEAVEEAVGRATEMG
ncbi:MAG: fibronectin type III domain-containing protein, partial [Candidatus Zixiibacteriota bacterium]